MISAKSNLPSGAVPVWLLDVDGVINANRPGWGAAPRKTTVAGFTIRWAPALIDRIRTMHLAGTVDIYWSTTWCSEPDSLRNLANALRMPADLTLALTSTRPAHQTWAELKAEAAVNVLEQGRRLIWTDDTEADVAPAFYPELAAAQADGRALLIAPRESRGLQRADLNLIDTFCEEN